VPSMFEVMQHQ